MLSERTGVRKGERENLSDKNTTECCVMEFGKFKKAEKTWGAGAGRGHLQHLMLHRDGGGPGLWKHSWVWWLGSLWQI